MRTNTPLQALVMMNDPMVLEASRVLAEKLMQEKSTTDEKIKKAFQLILCRKAEEPEQTLLKKYFEEQKLNFNADPEKAKQLVQAGEHAHENISDTVSLASLMQVVNTIYNTDEAITK